jgi:hypothetical protein
MEAMQNTAHQNTTRPIAAPAITGAATANTTAGPAGGIQHPPRPKTDRKPSRLPPGNRIAARYERPPAWW